MKSLVINLQNIYLLHKFIYLLIEEHIKTFDLNTEGLAQNGILYFISGTLTVMVIAFQVL